MLAGIIRYNKYFGFADSGQRRVERSTTVVRGRKTFSAVIHTVHGMVFRGICIQEDSLLGTDQRRLERNTTVY
jgi:hypothetical protein